MIFETIVTLWILYMLHAPLWIWIIACLAAIESFYAKYEQTELKKKFDGHMKATSKLVNDLLDWINEIKERAYGKEIENNDNAE